MKDKDKNVKKGKTISFSEMVSETKENRVRSQPPK